VAGLLVRLEDGSEGVRSSAAVALGRIGSEEVVGGLLARLEDESAGVRSSAAGALGQIGGEGAVGGLLARLDDESADVRSRAAEALGQIGDEAAIPALLPMLEQTDYILFGGDYQRVCDGAYALLIDLLGRHAIDPGVEPQRAAQEPAVSGPWSVG
jgi:HEAT repeat protein